MYTCASYATARVSCSSEQRKRRLMRVRRQLACTWRSLSMYEYAAATAPVALSAKARCTSSWFSLSLCVGSLSARSLSLSLSASILSASFSASLSAPRSFFLSFSLSGGPSRPTPTHSHYFDLSNFYYFNLEI